MSRRHVLEDSDSDDDDAGGPSTGAGGTTSIEQFFTSEELLAIERCNIQTNNDGKYSEDSLTASISTIGEPPLEVADEGGTSRSHEMYRVQKGKEKDFFEQNVYMVHDPDLSDVEVSPTEENILLQIEAIRRSEKAIKNRMFKQKKTGGMVVFGPWWNYSLKRTLELSEDESVDNSKLGEYTAVMIMKSLFALVKDDLKEVLKSGTMLSKLST